MDNTWVGVFWTVVVLFCVSLVGGILYDYSHETTCNAVMHELTRDYYTDAVEALKVERICW